MKKRYLAISSFCLFTVIISLFLFNAYANTQTTYTLPVTYTNSDQYVQFSDDIVVASDPNFSNIISGAKVSVNEQSKVVSCSVSKKTIGNNTLYIKIPSYFVGQSINTIELSLNNIVNATVPYANQQWLNFVDIDETISSDNSTKRVTLTIDVEGNCDILPRFPVLVIDGQEYYGAAGFSFDDDFILNEVTFIFDIPVDVDAEDGILYIDEIAKQYPETIITQSK